jgi:site-specific DNA recombinase
MSRNYEEWIRLDKALYSNDLTIHFYQNNRVINKQANFNDRFLIHIELAVASQLSDKISQDVREANRHLLSRGIALRTVWGYTRDRETKRLVIDPDTAPTLRYIFDEFDAGSYSLRSFIEHLATKGIRSPDGRDWKAPNQIRQILTNPIYHGEYYSRGQDALYSCNHEPYYDKSRYEERLRRLGMKRAGRRAGESDFIFEGLLRCSCGRIMSGDDKSVKRKGGTMGTVIYYVHKCAHTQNERGRPRQISFREEEVVRLIDQKIAAERFSDHFADTLKTAFREYSERNRQNHATDRAAFATRIAALEQKKDRLLDALIEGAIDDRAALNSKLNQLNLEINAEEKRKKALSVGNDQFLSRIAEVIDYLRDAPRTCLEAPLAEKVAVFRTLADGVILNGQSAEILWKQPYSFLMRPDSAALRADLGRVRKRNTVLPRDEDFRMYLADVSADFRLWILSGAC